MGSGMGCSSAAGTAAGLLGPGGLGLVHPVVLEEADHHLIPVLLAPDDELAGVGIVGVAGGVIVAGDVLDGTALGDADRLGQVVIGLPVEIVARYRQQDLAAAIGADQREDR